MSHWPTDWFDPSPKISPTTHGMDFLLSSQRSPLYYCVSDHVMEQSLTEHGEIGLDHKGSETTERVPSRDPDHNVSSPGSRGAGTGPGPQRSLPRPFHRTPPGGCTALYYCILSPRAFLTCVYISRARYKLVSYSECNRSFVPPTDQLICITLYILTYVNL